MDLAASFTMVPNSKTVAFAQQQEPKLPGTSSSSHLEQQSKTLDFSTPQQGIPSSIFTTATRERFQKVYDPQKRYKLFIAPSNPSPHCFGCLRGGHACCVDINCQATHGGPHLKVEPGDAFIRRSLKHIFLEPSINVGKHSFTILQQWMEEANTLSEWVEKIQLVNCCLKEDPNDEVTPERLVAASIQRQEALAFKSSRQRRPKTLLEPSALGELLDINTDEMINDTSGEQTKTLITQIQSSLNKVITFVRDLHDEHRGQNVNNDITLTAAEEKMYKIESLLGTKPDDLLEHADAPTLCASIALIGSELNVLSKSIDQKVATRFKKQKSTVDLQTISIIENEMKHLNGRIDSTQQSVLSIAQGLQQQLQQLFGIQNTPACSNLGPRHAYKLIRSSSYSRLLQTLRLFVCVPLELKLSKIPTSGYVSITPLLASIWKASDMS